MSVQLIAWDFDGVLNRVQNDQGAVAAAFERDIGLSFEHFVAHMFTQEHMGRVLTGAETIEDLFGDWLAGEGSELQAETLLTWWLEANHAPDEEMAALAERLPHRQIIATNNEARRAAYIRELAGWGARVEAIFASGPMGVAKPDPGFFAQITEWSGLTAGEILLIDDNTQSIEAARALGWQTFLFNDETREALPAALGLS
ncbi:MAG: HAD-IA family hydrolase [Maritimibacter sp.]